MRFFHTHKNCEDSGLFGSDLIGRSTKQLVPLQIKDKVIPFTKKGSHTSYQSRSKLEIMADNLANGLGYVRKQIDNMQSIDDTISLLRQEFNRSRSFKPSHNSQSRPEKLLLYQALNSLCNEEMLGHSLFGYGYENPIRIHLKFGSLVTVHPIPVLPLLASHSLQALLASALWSEPPGQGLFESLRVDLINFLLGAKEEEASLEKRKLDLIEYGKGRSRLREYSEVHRSTAYSLSRKLVKRLIHSITFKSACP